MTPLVPLLLITSAMALEAPDSLMAPADMSLPAVTARMGASALHRVEGVWKFPADGGTMAIERVELPDGGTEYVMAVVGAGNRQLLPGTVIGRLQPTAKRDMFMARIFTGIAPDGLTLTSPKTFTVKLADSDSRLELQHVRKGVRLNWWRLLPYMFRRFVSEVDDTPRNLDGCVRVYPAPAIPHEPRYL